MPVSLGTCDFVLDHPVLTGRASSPVPCGRPAVVALSGLVQGYRCRLHATAAGTDFERARDEQALRLHPPYAAASAEGEPCQARADLRVI